ncbi:unnamed protein product [Symbiodinium natans]|uniref:Glycosyltransferase 2-like domain-containing protein n=1 Tax=Symbiodinium natans TaxID=878477 RepID=A0A812UR48_9DINO|nr:unnamed protein product [Symbiodinium natans]
MQDYPGPMEVVVVDDSPQASELTTAGNVPVRYFHLTKRHTIGEKRNMAVSAASQSDADVICIWDDDDIFTVDRLRQQVSRMFARNASCSSIQVAFVAVLPQKGRPGVLQRCKGMPLPFENSFCFRRSWLEERPPFTNSSLGEGNALFEGLSDWYSEAQPVPGEELPFLYIRTASSTAPDDALEPYPVRSMLLAPKEGAARLDLPLLALARALRRQRFPELTESCPGAAALVLVRESLKAALEEDLQAMSANVADSQKLAPTYWKALCGPGPAPGPAGEAPEGSRNPDFAPENLNLENRPPAEVDSDPLPPPERALELLRVALRGL